jgi:hypothetical protein
VRNFFNLLRWRGRTKSNAMGRNQRRSTMGEIVTESLREALNDPRVRYRIVDAWRRRTAKELHDATETVASKSSANKPIARKSEVSSGR